MPPACAAAVLSQLSDPETMYSVAVKLAATLNELAAAAVQNAEGRGKQDSAAEGILQLVAALISSKTAWHKVVQAVCLQVRPAQSSSVLQGQDAMHHHFASGPVAHDVPCQWHLISSLPSNTAAQHSTIICQSYMGV